MSDYPHGPTSTVQRAAKRAVYDAATIHAIIDACPIAHIGIADAAGPVVIPSIVWRIDSCLFTHGSQASRLLKAIASGNRTCFTFTRLDGLVAARSAFFHSMNFRSVVAFGHGEAIGEREEKARVLGALLDWLLPGRNGLIRPPNDQELDATAVVRIPIAEASAKIHAGPPMDPPADLSVPAWAGVIPRIETWGTPVSDAHCQPGFPAPRSLGAG